MQRVVLSLLLARIIFQMCIFCSATIVQTKVVYWVKLSSPVVSRAAKAEVSLTFIISMWRQFQPIQCFGLDGYKSKILNLFFFWVTAHFCDFISLVFILLFWAKSFQLRLLALTTNSERHKKYAKIYFDLILCWSTYWLAKGKKILKCIC